MSKKTFKACMFDHSLNGRYRTTILVVASIKNSTMCFMYLEVVRKSC